MTDLQRVRSDTRLFIPRNIDVPDRTWLGPGGIVDRDAPRMRELTEGQAYKFDPAPAGSQPNPVPRAIRHHIEKLDEQDARRARGASTPKAEAAKAAAARADEAGVSSGIQKPDERPKKTKPTEAASPA